VLVEAEEQAHDQGDEAPVSMAVVVAAVVSATILVVTITAVVGTGVRSGGGVGDAGLDRMDGGRGDRRGVEKPGGPDGRRAQWKGRQHCGQREARGYAAPLHGQPSTGGQAYTMLSSTIVSPIAR
jgi:hypothetical protein